LRADIMNVARALAEPSILDASAHLLAVGQKAAGVIMNRLG
jgi:hypothetical protein